MSTEGFRAVGTRRREGGTGDARATERGMEGLDVQGSRERVGAVGSAG